MSIWRWLLGQEPHRDVRERWIADVAELDGITEEEAAALYERARMVARRWPGRPDADAVAGLLLTGARRQGVTVAERLATVEAVP